MSRSLPSACGTRMGRIGNWSGLKETARTIWRQAIALCCGSRRMMNRKATRNPMRDPNYDPAKANQYRSYTQGWIDGAGVRAMKPQFTTHTDEKIKEEYVRGYTDGRDARAEATMRASERIGYEPSILRTA